MTRSEIRQVVKTAAIAAQVLVTLGTALLIFLSRRSKKNV